MNSLMLNRLRAKINDVHYAISLEAGVRRANYSLSDFFTDEAAANPSLQLFNLKVLELCRPSRILELGSGQTTKLLSCYARKNPSAYVLTLEQDKTWVERLKDQISHDYQYSPLKLKEFTCEGSGLTIGTTWYEYIPEGSFDFIVIDGPDYKTVGTDHADFSRSGILEHIPSILPKKFIVVFDDAERHGELMTVKALTDILNACGIDFVSFAIHGIKTQIVFCSPELSFLGSI